VPSRLAAIVLGALLVVGVAEGAQPPKLPFIFVATFGGTIPCAGCAGIFAELTLRSNGTFSYKQTYLGKNVIPYVDRGMWKYDPQRSRLILKGSSPHPSYYRIKNEDTIVMLDARGNPLPSRLDHSLTRGATPPVPTTAPAPPPPTPKFAAPTASPAATPKV